MIEGIGCCSSGPSPKPRYGTYTTGDRPELAVRVTAADFNGNSFDGRPFSTIPNWLIDAELNGSITICPHGCTDYARWDVKTPNGIVTAEPDDWIIRRENGDLSVVQAQDAYVLINLRPPVEKLLNA